MVKTSMELTELPGEIPYRMDPDHRGSILFFNSQTFINRHNLSRKKRNIVRPPVELDVNRDAAGECCLFLLSGTVIRPSIVLLSNGWTFAPTAFATGTLKGSDCRT